MPALLVLVLLGLAALSGAEVPLPAPAPHPRLLLRPDSFDRAAFAGDPLLVRLAGRIRADADALLDAPPARRELQGQRLPAGRLVLRRLLTLAAAVRLDRDPRHLGRVEAELRALADWPDWNPRHFLDTAAIATGVALCVDWLDQDLDPGTRSLARGALRRHALLPSLHHDHWTAVDTNWNQVCHAGVVLAALATWEDDPALAARLVERMRVSLPRAMAMYAPDGAYPEGPWYYAFGTSATVLLIDGLRTALGSDLGLADSPGFRASAGYYLHAVGPTWRLFAYGDGRDEPNPPPTLAWFAREAGDAQMWAHERQALAWKLGHRAPGPELSSWALAPLALVWRPPAVPAEAAGGPRHWTGGGPTPVSMHRSGWDADAAYVAIKGGSPAVNHGHMDVGGFVADLLGRRWAEDPGLQEYGGLQRAGIDLWNMAQDSSRWTVFRLGPEAHSILRLDGRPQPVGAHAGIIRSGPGGAVLDCSAFHPGQAAMHRRGVRLAGDRIEIQDELQLIAQAGLHWAMTTRATVRLTGPRTAVLAADGREVVLRLHAPEGGVLGVEDRSPPASPWDEADPGLAQVVLRGPAGPGPCRITAVIAPVAAAIPDPEPLDAWSLE